MDFTETFSPVVKIESLRCLFTIAAINDHELYHVDVTSAFLYGKLEETMFMKIPEGVDADGQGDCVLLHKALPGCKQSGRAWNHEISDFFQSEDFKAAPHDPCLYMRIRQGRTVLVGVEVDDMAMSGTSEDLDELVTALSARFEITIERELKWFLNIAVARNRARRTITLSQQRYVTNALARFDMANCKPAATPANTDPLLPATQESSISDLPMREAVGALLWPARITRPDMLNAVLRVARFTSAPTQQAWQAVKRIFRYLKGTSHYALELGQV